MSEAAPSTFSSPKGLPLPRVFGRLLLLKLVARGGMGDVYLAATTGIEGAERPCIVKTVRRDHIHDGSFLARFLDEARVQAQLCHPSVAQVLEAATDENGEARRTCKGGREGHARGKRPRGLTDHVLMRVSRLNTISRISIQAC